MHAEVPDVGVATHLLPGIHTGDHRVHDHRSLQVIEGPPQAGVDDHPADVLADKREPPQLNHGDELIHHGGQLALGAVGGRAG